MSKKKMTKTKGFNLKKNENELKNENVISIFIILIAVLFFKDIFRIKSL